MTRRKPTPEQLAAIAELDATDPLPTTNATMTAAEAEQVAARAWAEANGWVTDPLPQPNAEQEPYDVMSYAHVLLSTSDGWTHTPDGRRYVMVNDDHTTNPYLLESSKILSDLAAEAYRAQLTIDALDKEIEHLTADADFQIRRIEARRNAEISQRTARVNDLMKIVSANTIVNGAKESSE